MKVTSGPPAENVNETLVYRYMSNVLETWLTSQDAQKKSVLVFSLSVIVLTTEESLFQ